jgi:hypothetical protein
MPPGIPLSSTPCPPLTPAPAPAATPPLGTTYSGLKEFRNKLGLKVSAMDTLGDKTMATMCTNTTVAMCENGKSVTPDNGANVTVTLTLPPASETSMFAGGTTPINYRVYICYGEGAVKRRKWRKFNNIIKARSYFAGSYVCV